LPRKHHELPPKPAPMPVKTTYESAPILRDLRKEAAALVPVAVKRKLEAEKAAKMKAEEEKAQQGTGSAAQEGDGGGLLVMKKINAAPDVDEELSRFQAEMEEVEDEEA
jgi:hypothetical protein